MHGQAEEAVRDLRSRMAVETRTLRELEKQFQHPYFKRRAVRAINDTEEAEIMFLRPLEKENWRDLQQELAAVEYAETIFQMAVSQRKQLKEVPAKYGPTAVVVPYLSTVVVLSPLSHGNRHDAAVVSALNSPMIFLNLCGGTYRRLKETVDGYDKASEISSHTRSDTVGGRREQNSSINSDALEGL